MANENAFAGFFTSTKGLAHWIEWLCAGQGAGMLRPSDMGQGLRRWGSLRSGVPLELPARRETVFTLLLPLKPPGLTFQTTLTRFIDENFSAMKATPSYEVRVKYAPSGQRRRHAATGNAQSARKGRQTNSGAFGFQVAPESNTDRDAAEIGSII